MKLKTLKDIGIKEKEQWEDYHVLKALGRFEQLTRQEAIKWVKDDFKINPTEQEDKVTKRWMERLDISDEDLK